MSHVIGIGRIERQRALEGLARGQRHRFLDEGAAQTGPVVRLLRLQPGRLAIGAHRLGPLLLGLEPGGGFAEDVRA